MKTLKRALWSFFVGALLSVAPIVTVAACDSVIYVQDQPDCHYYSRQELAGQDCNADGSVCSCAYLSTGSIHREDTCDGGYILNQPAY
jgi:hypothetical protein